MLEYKGYIGEVVYDSEAEVLHARVINQRHGQRNRGGRATVSPTGVPPPLVVQVAGQDMTDVPA